MSELYLQNFHFLDISLESLRVSLEICKNFLPKIFFFYPFVENSVKLSLVNFPTAISMYLYNSYEMSLNDVEKMDARRFLWSFCTGFQALWPSTK